MPRFLMAPLPFFLYEAQWFRNRNGTRGGKAAAKILVYVSRTVAKKDRHCSGLFGRNSRTRPPPTLNNLLRAPQALLVCKSQASPLCVLALHALQEARLKQIPTECSVFVPLAFMS